MTYRRESARQIAERLRDGIKPTPVFQDEKRDVPGAIAISTIRGLTLHPAFVASPSSRQGVSPLSRFNRGEGE